MNDDPSTRDDSDTYQAPGWNEAITSVSVVVPRRDGPTSDLRVNSDLPFEDLVRKVVGGSTD